MLSIDELIREVSSIKVDSDQLSTMIASAGTSLSSQSNTLAGLVRGSRTGQDAVMALSVAARSMSNAAASMKTLSRTCDQCVANLSK